MTYKWNLLKASRSLPKKRWVSIHIYSCGDPKEGSLTTCMRAFGTNAFFHLLSPHRESSSLDTAKVVPNIKVCLSRSWHLTFPAKNKLHCSLAIPPNANLHIKYWPLLQESGDLLVWHYCISQFRPTIFYSLIHSAFVPVPQHAVIIKNSVWNISAENNNWQFRG